MLWKILLILSFSYAISCEPTNAMTTVAQAFRQYGSKTSIMTVKKDTKVFAVRNATKDLSFNMSQISFPKRNQDPSHPSNTKCTSYFDISAHHFLVDGHTIPLIANSVEYMVDVDVGFPPQRLRVQVDTGSALFVVPSKKCVECDQHKTLYDPSQSQSSRIISCSDPECTSHQCDENNRCSFLIKYGDGASFGGYLARDLIGLGDSENNSIYTVGHIGSVVSDPGGREAMGILGLAYSIKKLTCLPNCATPYYDQLVLEGKVSNVFSLALTKTEDADGSLILGKLYFPTHHLLVGGIDSDIASSYSQASAEDTIIYYTPVVEKSYYAVSLKDMYVGNVSVSVPKSKIPKTAVDSGTTLMIVNSQMYQNIKNTFQSNYCDLPHICTDSNIFQYYTSNSSVNKNCIDSQTIRPIFSKFPNITIVLEGIALTLTPQDYMELTRASSGYDYYCFGIFDGGAKSLTILGDTFMKSFYVVFDREASRVGFVGRPGTINAVTIESTSPSWLWIFGAIVLLVLAAITVVYAVVMLLLFIQKRKTHRYQLLTQEQDLLEDSQVELSL